MDFSSREILIALGLLVVLGIVLDAVRRVRSAREGSLRNTAQKQPIFEDDFDERSSELPSGGARVVGYRDEQTANKVNHDIRSAAEQEIKKVTTAFRELEQVPLELGDSAEEAQNGLTDSSTNNNEQAKVQVMVVHLMAPPGEVYGGQDLQNVFMAQNLHAGEKGIFHRHRQKNGSGPVWFSLASAINPGTFDLDSMTSFTTPGLTFFMVLDNTDEAVPVFDEMIATARSLADSLGGELKDEQRSTLTKQTLAHCRQQVVDYTRQV